MSAKRLLSPNQWSFYNNNQNPKSPGYSTWLYPYRYSTTIAFPKSNHHSPCKSDLPRYPSGTSRPITPRKYFVPYKAGNSIYRSVPHFPLSGIGWSTRSLSRNRNYAHLYQHRQTRKEPIYFPFRTRKTHRNGTRNRPGKYHYSYNSTLRTLQTIGSYCR